MRKNAIWLFMILVVVMNFTLLFRNNKNERKIEELSNQKIFKTEPKNEQTKEVITKEININRNNAITHSVNKVKAAVVSVNVMKTEIVKKYYDPFNSPFFNYFEYAPKTVKSIGSGIIYNEKGCIITNHHVIEGATQIKIVLNDDRVFNASIIGFDKFQDIAILKIDGENIPYAKLGNSDEIIIGEWSIAIGNPYGYLLDNSDPTVSVGVISAINRDFTNNNQGRMYKKMIQTDTAINPGNSGGPLIDVSGKVIGINTFIFSESGGSIGLGFAIPINRVKEIAYELEKFGRIRKVEFGFYTQNINRPLAAYLKLNSTEGVIVTYVKNNGAAEKAGLKKHDIILEIDKTKIKNAASAELIVSDIRVGESISLEVLRDGKKINLNIIAQEYR